MTEQPTYIDCDGDELYVRPADYGGVPHATIGVLAADGRLAAVHIPPDRAWDICEAILVAAGANTGPTTPTPEES
ncbi:hypothetical protein [Nonomuraea sp. NPDC023979]|uniref:hypothetical protein n=1 Tax=Nonomuraea sp. NPDC023979 TaxID=3154796 RepID=UPI0033C27D7D